MRANSQLCTFFLGDLLLGVEVRQVQEVVRHQELTRVPLAPGPIRGLLNLRGQIVLAIDLRLPDRVTVRLSDAAAQAREEARKPQKRKGGDA